MTCTREVRRACPRAREHFYFTSLGLARQRVPSFGQSGYAILSSRAARQFIIRAAFSDATSFVSRREASGISRAALSFRHPFKHYSIRPETVTSSLGASLRACTFIPVTFAGYRNPLGSSAFENRTAMNLRNSERPRLCARVYRRRVPREKSLLREARSKNRYAWVYRARKFRARRNVRVIPDHFEQNGHYDPLLIVIWQTYRFPVR